MMKKNGKEEGWVEGMEELDEEMKDWY